MDTSPEYIRMCEKAVEIQELWEPLGGDIFIGWASIDIVKEGEEPKELMVAGLLWGDEIMPQEGYSTWLPRQDQLQEMVDDPEIRWKWDLIGRWFERLPAKVTAYYLGYGRGQTKYPDTKGLGSDEQLWLAFVMSENFNKTWNGEDWVIRG